MPYQKDFYTIRRKSREIIHTQVVSNRPVGCLSEAEVASLVDDPQVRWFVHAERGALMPVDEAEIRGYWESQVRGHVSGEEGSVDDYPRGYFFIAEMWHGGEGSKIVVLQYRH